MPTKPTAADPQPDLGAVLRGLGDDTKELLRQQAELFRAEAGQELRRAGGAAARVAAGGGLAAAGGFLAGLAAARGLSRVTGLPLGWGYALAAAGLGAAGAKLLLAGRDGFAGLRPLPQTTAALGENLEWLTGQLRPAGG
ncbi:MAG TPA: phage holin family protein [Urbifossiella sp.]|nr:phage holin family protein [Urbifossiella sp.]